MLFWPIYFFESGVWPICCFGRFIFFESGVWARVVFLCSSDLFIPSYFSNLSLIPLVPHLLLLYSRWVHKNINNYHRRSIPHMLQIRRSAHDFLHRTPQKHQSTFSLLINILCISLVGFEPLPNLRWCFIAFKQISVTIKGRQYVGLEWNMLRLALFGETRDMVK